MRLNLLLVLVAALYGAAGLAFTFAPIELLGAMGAHDAPVGIWLGQLLGAALLGLACLNWMQRYAIIGGIYGRPLLLGNFLFSTPAAFASFRLWRTHGGLAALVATLVLWSITVAFGVLMRRPPATKKEEA